MKLLPTIKKQVPLKESFLCNKPTTMKKILTFLLIGICTTVSAQKEAYIATVNKVPISVAEFKRGYEKNLHLVADTTENSVEAYLELYVNYKLKVLEAYAEKLDTLPSYQRELATYQRQLMAPYLRDDAFTKQLIATTYDRIKNERRARHLLIRIPKNATAKDTLVAYEKINTLRKEILGGASFEAVAKRASEDPSAKNNGGDLGYFSAFKMVYPFEEAAYTTAIGAVSQPFKTQFGYHLVQPIATRASRGSIEVAHILITDTSALGKATIDSVYAQLQQGADFKTMAAKYSNDTNSKTKGGRLPKFEGGRMVPTFESAAFLLTKPLSYGAPIQTKFGWHILQLIAKFPVESFETMEAELTKKIKKSSRGKLSNEAVLNRLKKTYTIVENPAALQLFLNAKKRIFSKDSMQAVLFSVAGKEFTQAAFSVYSKTRTRTAIKVLYTRFKDQEILRYFKENLEFTAPEYGQLLQEYREGLLLFELMQQKVWNKAATDTLGLQAYYDAREASYIGKKLDAIRGRVMNDYQNSLELLWVASLRKKYPVKIKKSALRKLIKKYKI